MMFDKLFWWPEMFIKWDVFEMLIWDVLIWLEMLLTWVLLSHSWLCRIHCIFKMELMLVDMACIGEFWDEGYALLTPLLIGKFLRWKFCSNGTTCIRIVLSRIPSSMIELLCWWINYCILLIACCVCCGL